MSNLQRFITAQSHEYSTALSEIKNGRKQSHWMWYIFPQIAGLGFSAMSQRYAIKDLGEATEYSHDPILGSRLIEISNELLTLESKSVTEIFGKPDDMKLRSCMTLFGKVEDADLVFQKVLDKYFDGEVDTKTVGLLR